jgi:sec-independent protein translocase protein TatA
VSFGFGEILLVLAIVMLLFGAKKLPELARGLGAGIRNFKGEINAPKDDDDQDGPKSLTE